MFVFLTPIPRPGFGEAGGITAGRGIDGAGDAERRNGEELPNEERLLWDVGSGGFMGSARDVGVPGVDGRGDRIEGNEASSTRCGRLAPSDGAGLAEEIRLAGRSILDVLPCWASENCPSFVLSL